MPAILRQKDKNLGFFDGRYKSRASLPIMHRTERGGTRDGIQSSELFPLTVELWIAGIGRGC